MTSTKQLLHYIRLQKHFLFSYPIASFSTSFSKSNNTLTAISSEEYKERRMRLIQQLTQNAKRKQANPSVIGLICSRRGFYSAPDVPYPYRPCSHFRYLSGITQQNCRLVFHMHETVLFFAQQNEHQALWEGESTSAEKLALISGVDQVLPISEFESYFASLLRTNSFVSTEMHKLEEDGFYEQDLKRTHKILSGLSHNVFPLFVEVDKLRLIKSPSEQQHMRVSCRIGSEAINALFQHSRAFNNESQLVGLLELEFRRRGATRLAYPPVVASGRNSCTLHYISADKHIDLAECLLIDSGGETSGGYCSDITRCFPHSGRFSSSQKVVYDVLEHVQNLLLDYVKNTRPLKLNELYFFMLDRMGDALLSSVFFKRDRITREELLHECDKLCPHHVSHYLGMDVHDTPTVSRAIDLSPGVVITVEPGIYVRPGNKLVRDEFRHIGMRIEDDVLITETGAEVLTQTCLRASDDIEFVMDK